ncbi:MAG: PfkB family carbohydrate kinase, partial [Aestuariivirga sp.]
TARDRISRSAGKVKVADTVGAGDTFTAGLITALQRAKLLTKTKLGAISAADLDAALAFAARAAAVTVSRPGCDPPWASELA